MYVIQIVLLAALAGTGPASDLIPAGYYATANESSAATLRASVHEIIDDHTRYPYTSPIDLPPIDLPPDSQVLSWQ